MSDSNSGEYYRGRAAKAKAMAEGATSQAIRKIHLTMAAEYEALANGSPIDRPPLRIARG